MDQVIKKQLELALEQAEELISPFFIGVDDAEKQMKPEGAALLLGESMQRFQELTQEIRRTSETETTSEEEYEMDTKFYLSIVELRYLIGLANRCLEAQDGSE